MDRVGSRDLGSHDDGRNVEVAVRASRRADAHVLVGKADVQRILVGFRIDRDGFDAKLAAREDDAHRDLAAIRNQNFLEHSYSGGPYPPVTLRGAPNAPLR